MINTPDYDRAASAAMQLLIDHQVKETPINPMPIMLNYPGVRVMPYASVASEAGIDRKDLIYLFGGQDASTFYLDPKKTDPSLENVRYVVIYNMYMPTEIMWRGIARELGHIVLGHDGATRSNAARMAEAKCFAHHLISPRPILHLLQQNGPLTMNVLINTTGCSYECVEELQTIPGAHVPVELNLHVRDLFSPHLLEYLDFYHLSPKKDRSHLVDLGTFMDGYEE